PQPNERFLRPPGAVPPGTMETGPDGAAGTPRKSFEEACTRCNKCVEVCPAQAIKLDPAGLIADGLPYILARNTACVVCDSLACMHNCPDGALLPIPKTAIRMGRAEVNQDTCLHHPLDTTRETGFAKTAFGSLPAKESFNCQACVDICPLGTAAILISPRTGRVRVQIARDVTPDEPETVTGCIGCGLCEQACPVGPEAAIIVRPVEVRPDPIIA
ncbi:MAG: 4Fe-4S dicluster domain-containing protein, partial [Phycisphaerae bacterium]